MGVRFPQSYYKELTALYTRKRDVFLAGLDRLGLKHNVPQGTYFVLLDISDFLALDRFRGWSDLEFCEWMIREIGVAAVPGSSFFREPVNHLIRLHFARSEETLNMPWTGWPSWPHCCIKEVLRHGDQTLSGRRMDEPI